MKPHCPKPIVLLILDGFGYSESAANNAIRMAATPNWDRLWATCSHTLLDCSGAAVGLPDDQMGNSEVGHLHLGGGRLLAQDFTRINMAIANRTFFSNPALCNAVRLAKDTGKSVHILGLLSPGGVHSHELHLQAMVELAIAQGVTNVYVHAFLDGRDMPPKSAAASILALESRLSQMGGGKIASLIGRFYAMDRDNRWERISPAYQLLVAGEAPYLAETAEQGLELAYGRGETDEFVQATAIVKPGELPVHIDDGDVVIFMNFRADRARELSQCLADPEFAGFEREKVPQLGAFVTLTEYHEDFKFPVAFPPDSLANGLGEVLSRQGLKQLRLAETEKYAHVTFFFNGGQEQPFPGETRILVPSPKVRTYDLQPEMSAPEVTEQLVTAIRSNAYDVIICNYANCDMVGHTGQIEASIQAVQAIDSALGKIAEALAHVGGELLVTADHGNVEQMVDPVTGEVQTAHSTNPVPLLYQGSAGKLLDGGNLADVAPTLLAIMGIGQPEEMTGRSLLV